MNKRSSNPLKMGLIVNPRSGSRYVHEFMKWLREQDHLQLSHIVFEQGTGKNSGETTPLGPAPGPGRLIQTLQKTFLSLLTAVEGFLLRDYPEHKDHLRTYDIEKQSPHTLYVTPRFTDQGPVYQYSEEDVRRIKDLDLDLLIKFSPGILHGDIANAAGLGSIALHYQDERTNRNGPPGFWEVYSRQATTGFTIQRITKDPRSGEILMRGHSWTQWFYLNQAFLFRKANYHLIEVVRRIGDSGTLRAQKEPQPYYNRLYTCPSLRVHLA